MSDNLSTTEPDPAMKDGSAKMPAAGNQTTGGEAEGPPAATPSGEFSEEVAASFEAPRDGGIDSLFDRLVIREEEFDDLIIEEVDVDLSESTRWLAVARVHCDKGFSHEAFFQQMRAAWNPAREVSIRPVGTNRLVIQFFCLGDWEKVTERGPWL
jgi:hypothetical protein